MTSNYKRIGDYIHLVDTRNKKLDIETLLGLSINKEFIPSVANTIGTNMANYKIIKRGQFACSLMQVRRDKKIPVALQLEFEAAIISQAYPVFEITDSELLDPEYLMMWMSRSEFDREACFLAVGGVRGSLEWEDFCDMELPVPSIEKQREIVREYNVVNDRIALNEKLTQKLEYTAQAIYKQWFVDLEFPITKEYAESIGKPELEGKPYKSSGGEMVYCEDLDKELPKGWLLKPLSELCILGSSKRIFQHEYTLSGIPFYRGKEVTLSQNGDLIKDPLFISEDRFNELDSKFGSPQRGDILITAVGTIGSTYQVKNEKFYFKDGNIIWLKNFIDKALSVFIYDFMQSNTFTDYLKDITIGSTQNAITIKSLGNCPVMIPNNDILNLYSLLGNSTKSYTELIASDKRCLSELTKLIFSKMSKTTV